jgi:hypothetical protein
VVANFTQAFREEFSTVRGLISALNIAVRRAPPSHMSDAGVDDCDHFPVGLKYPDYPIPQLAHGDEDGRALVDRIKQLLADARRQPPRGSEGGDRVYIIDPFLVAVAKLFNMDCWNEDLDENRLVLHDVSDDEPRRTSGFIDKVVTMATTTRARLLGYEIKAIT